MAAGRYDEPLLKASGQPRRNVDVTVFLRGTDDLADVYADEELAEPLSNPLPKDQTPHVAGLDSLGNLAFYAEEGDYDLDVEGDAARIPISLTGVADAAAIGALEQAVADLSALFASGLFAAAADEVPLTARGSDDQTANLQEWQTDDGTVVGAMSALGSFEMQRHFNCMQTGPGDYSAIVAYAGPDSSDPDVMELALLVQSSTQFASLACNSGAGDIYPLVVQADTRLGENNQIWLGNHDDDGRVGIKTSNPEAQLHVRARSAGTPAFIAQGAAAQTAALAEFQNSAGAVKASIDQNGGLIATGARVIKQIDVASTVVDDFTSFNVWGGTVDDPNARLLSVLMFPAAGAAFISSAAAGAGVRLPLVLQADAANNQLTLLANGRVGIKTFTPTSALHVVGVIDADPVLIVQGADAQTGDLVQVRSDSATLWSISAAGVPRWDAAANQQTTVGAAGGASALPAAPTRYLRVRDSTGTVLVVPAYAAA